MRRERSQIYLAVALYLGLGLIAFWLWDDWRWRVGALAQAAGDVALVAYAAAGGPFLFVRLLGRARPRRSRAQ